MKSNNSIKTGKNSLSLSLSKCLKSLALFFKSIPTFFLNLISPAKLQTSQIKLNRSHTKAHNTFLTLFVGAGSFLIAFIFGSFLLIPSDSNAEDAATLANDASLSVALTPEAMNLAVMPTPDGTLASDEMAIQVSTDNTTGYTLALSLAGAETSLNDPASGGKIQSSIADINSPATLSVNTWGWYPDSLANNTGNLFSALPSNSDPYELKKTSSPTSGSGETTTISFGVNVDTTLPAGSYTNTIVISAVTNYVPQPILDVYPTTGWAGDTITLYSNGGFVNVQSVTIGGTDCTSIDVKSADELTCTLPSKAETDTTSGTDNGYSISVTASNTSLDTHNFTIRYFNPSTTTSMQEFTGTTCGSMSVGDIVSLTDERNGQTYRIKKMQDNKCWMVDNLKYAGEANTDLANVDGTYGLVYNNSGKYNTVDGTNTQSTENSDKAFYNNPMSGSYCYGDSIQSSYTKCGYLYNWYAATAGTGTYATSTDGTNVSGSICPTGWRLPSATSDGSTATGNGTSFTAADFAVLNASMNAGSLTTGSTSNYPTGWQYSGAWSGVFSGLWYSGFHGQGSNGYYWSSTAYSFTLARFLDFVSSSVRPGSYYDYKYYGFAVRCVMDGAITIYFDGNGADAGSMGLQSIGIGQSANLNANQFTREGYKFTGWNTIAGGTGTSYGDGANYTAPADPSSYTITLYAQWEKEATYMQDFTASQCSSLASSSDYTVTDRRDNNTYTVRYINGNCWMTQNLRLAGGTTLTSTYSNVSSSYTIPTTDLTSGNSYTDGRIHNSGNTTTGYWYNYCAASAGTVCSQTQQDASYDICPKGWRLPTRTEFDGITSYISAFSPVTGGFYYDGSLTNTSLGFWWSSTAYNIYNQYSLRYYNGSLDTVSVSKNFGHYVRCIRSS